MSANTYRYSPNASLSDFSWLGLNRGWPTASAAAAPMGSRSIAGFFPSRLLPANLGSVTLAQAGGIAVILCLIVAITVAIGYAIQVQLDQMTSATAKRSPLLQTNTVYWDGPSPDLVIHPRNNVLNKTADYVMFLDVQIQDRRRAAGRWRHIFHRGSAATASGTADAEVDPDKIAYMNPGVFLDREGSNLVIFVRSQARDGHATLEPVVLDNPPLLEPFRLALVMHGQILDVYVNGKLEKTKRFPHMLIQAPSSICGMYGRIGGQFAGTVRNLVVNSSPEAVTTEYIQKKGAPSVGQSDPTLWAP
jgi:hypothetical protein